MSTDSRRWLWTLLILYALYAAYWGEKLAHSAYNPFRSWTVIEVPRLAPFLQALLG